MLVRHQAEERGSKRAETLDVDWALMRLDAAGGSLDALAGDLGVVLGSVAESVLSGEGVKVSLPREHLIKGEPGVECRQTIACYKNGRRVKLQAAGHLLEIKTEHRKKWMGAESVVLVPFGGALRAWAVQYALWPLEDVIPSHMEDFRPSDRYPSELQERDYQRDQGEREKVILASTPAAWRGGVVVSDVLTMESGPPVVDTATEPGFAVVLGGNSRVMSIKRLVRSKAGRQVYRRALRQGLQEHAHLIGLEALTKRRDLASLILVRELLEDYDPKTISSDLNRGATQVIAISGAAVSCGRRMPRAVLAPITHSITKNGLTLSRAIEANNRIVTRLLIDHDVIPAGERARWLRQQRGRFLAQLSPAGMRHFRSCLVGALVQDSETLTDSPPSLLDLFGRIAAPLLQETAPEGSAWDLMPALRIAAREAAALTYVDNPNARYSTGDIFAGTEDAQVLEVAKNARAAVLTVWLYKGRKSPAVAANQAGAWADHLKRERRGDVFGSSNADAEFRRIFGDLEGQTPRRFLGNFKTWLVEKKSPPSTKAKKTTTRVFKTRGDAEREAAEEAEKKTTPTIEHQPPTAYPASPPKLSKGRLAWSRAGAGRYVSGVDWSISKAGSKWHFIRHDEFGERTPEIYKTLKHAKAGAQDTWESIKDAPDKPTWEESRNAREAAVRAFMVEYFTGLSSKTQDGLEDGTADVFDVSWEAHESEEAKRYFAPEGPASASQMEHALEEILEGIGDVRVIDAPAPFVGEDGQIVWKDWGDDVYTSDDWEIFSEEEGEWDIWSDDNILSTHPTPEAAKIAAQAIIDK